MLSREEIIATAGHLKRREVLVPEWNGSVLIRELTGAERDEVESMMLRAQKTNDFKGVRAKVVCLSCITENGERLFDIKNDASIISNLSASVLELLFKEACTISGMNPAEEGTEGNSQTTLTDMLGTK